MKTMQIAAVVLTLGISAAPVHAQEVRTSVPVQTQEPKRVQGFSVLLLLGEIQSAALPDNISAPARKALADIKDFLPYKSYRVLDTLWLAGGDGAANNSGGFVGLDSQNYQFLLRTFARDPLAKPGTEGAGLSRAQFRVWAPSPPGADKSNVTVLLDNSFNITAGETVVVGTSRLQSNRALIVLLTAVAAGK